jgi:hypothetical protein
MTSQWPKMNRKTPCGSPPCKCETLWSVLWLTTPLLRFRFPFDMEYGIAVVLGCGSKGDPQR